MANASDNRFFIRENLQHCDVEALYCGFPHLFSIKMHHGGVFTKFPGRSYDEGSHEYVDMLDVDKFSVHELDGIMHQIGYDKKFRRYYHYLVPNSDLDFGLRALGSDADVIGFLQHLSGNIKVMEVFVELEITSVHTYFCSPSKVRIQEVTDEELVAMEQIELGKNRMLLEWHDVETTNQPNEPTSVSQELFNCYGDVEGQPSLQEEQFDCFMNDEDFDPFFGEETLFGFRDVNENQGVNVNENEGANVNENEGANVNENQGGNSEPVDEQSVEHEESDSQSEQDDSEDSDFTPDACDNIEEDEVDMRDFRMHTDADVECNQSTDDIVMDDDVILDNDQFDSGIESDDNATSVRKRKQRQKVKEAKAKSKDSIFYYGQVFGTKEEVKIMVKEHGVETRRQLRVIKDDTTRVRAVCWGDMEDGGSHINNSTGGSSSKGKEKGGSSSKGKEKVVKKGPNGKGQVVKNVGGRGNTGEKNKHKCPWTLQLSKDTFSESWVIKTLVTEHKCLQSRNIYACTATFLSKKLMDQIKENPKIPVKAVQDQFQRRFEVGVSEMKAFRARQIALNKIHGDFKAQYGLLRDYLEELRRTNPGTTVKLQVVDPMDPESNERIFEGVYICLGSLKQGFKAIGRDLLGLDGAILKGPYPGQVLTAVGLDPNNGIYPVAYAIVEAESKNSWIWFLECLGPDIGINDTSGFTFISDRQKGIIPAVETVFPFAEHRFCVRHILENMKQLYRGQIYRDLLWKLATSTSVVHFIKGMDKLKKLNKDAHLWLSKINPKHWSRSHFTGRAISDVLLNNMCEILNSKLVDGRDKPIITMLEYIREYLMRRIVNVLTKIDRCTTMLTPYATKLFETVKKDANSYIVKWNGEEHSQVSGSNPICEQYVVNMRTRTCTCRSWEVSGIPCRHAVAAMFNMTAHAPGVGIPETYVNPLYSTERWKAVYSYKIYPVNGMSMWPKSQVPAVILPPLYHKPIGRPKKARKKSMVELDEGKKGKKRKYLSGGKQKQVGEGSSMGKEKKVATGRRSGGNVSGTTTCSRCKEKGHNKRSCNK